MSPYPNRSLPKPSTARYSSTKVEEKANVQGAFAIPRKLSLALTASHRGDPDKGSPLCADKRMGDSRYEQGGGMSAIHVDALVRMMLTSLESAWTKDRSGGLTGEYQGLWTNLHAHSHQRSTAIPTRFAALHIHNPSQRFKHHPKPSQYFKRTTNSLCTSSNTNVHDTESSMWDLRYAYLAAVML
ncbi:hypothetical protein NMY22_g15661 [Coprinellus aureogranulatus]|nr:hypothetical protein NMY22_g15661 [Coprinellus aureogranulatus]